MSDEKNIYLQPAFSDRVAELNRVELRSLYPSEAWSMYRILPHCKTVLDLGCGGPNMFRVSRQINPGIEYTGIDFNQDLVDQANAEMADQNATYVKSDIVEFLKKTDKHFDCVMTWGVTYSFADFYPALDALLESGRFKFFMFDMRVMNREDTLADVSLAWSTYGDQKDPYYVHSYQEFVGKLRHWESKLRRVEMAGYDFPLGSVSWITPDLPQPTILTVLLERRDEGDDAETEWFLRVPPYLELPPR